MSQKLRVNNLKWIKDTSQFNGDFVENCNEGSDPQYFLEADVQHLENYRNFMMIYHLYLTGRRLKMLKSL